MLSARSTCGFKYGEKRSALKKRIVWGAQASVLLATESFRESGTFAVVVGVSPAPIKNPQPARLPLQVHAEELTNLPKTPSMALHFHA